MKANIFHVSNDANIDKEYIPINKGHFGMDTEERTNTFYKILAEGWEEDYAEYRRLWEELPHTRTVRDYPLLIDLELADVCNLRCPMCPTVTAQFKKERRKGLMDFSLIKKIIDEAAANNVYSLRLSWVGESTLHPKFLDTVKYAKDKGIREVATLTNASKKLDFFEKVVDAGMDWITISIDGINEQYEKVRKPLKFADTLAKLKGIKEYKDKKGLKKPVIKIQGVWPAIRVDPSEYYNTLAPYVDLIAYNPLIDYLHKDSEIVYEDNFSCPQHYQRIVIASDGRAVMCSSDDYVEEPIGDTRVQTIHEIWHGDRLNKMREIHSEHDGFKKLKPCAKCFYPRKVEANEESSVNGRKIVIENYVNRKQEIGQ